METDIVLPAGFSNSYETVQQPFFVGGAAGYLPVRALTDTSDAYLLIYRTMMAARLDLSGIGAGWKSSRL